MRACSGGTRLCVFGGVRRELYSNQLKGSVPDSIGRLTQLMYLYVRPRWLHLGVCLCACIGASAGVGKERTEAQRVRRKLVG